MKSENEKPQRSNEPRIAIAYGGSPLSKNVVLRWFMVNFTVRKQQRFSVLLRSMEDLYLVILWFFLWFLRSAARKTFLFQPSYNLVVVC